MEFRILGPLEVDKEGGAVPVGRRKQRAVLAMLVLHPGRVVSVERLIDAVWGEAAPETAHTILQGYVSALRKTLGPELIVTRSPGYALQADPASIDLERFESFIAAGKESLAAGDATAASEQLDMALSLWRGEPLGDLDSISFVEGERARLEELRLGAMEERVEAQLALGQHAVVIAGLQSLVRDHPLRERLRGQLMLALYRSGRQAEALEVYRQGRHLLADDLGLEPGEPLQRLERAILEHDPKLGSIAPPPARQPPRPEEPPAQRAAPRARVRRRRVGVIAGACVFAGVVAGLTVALTRGGQAHVDVIPNSIAVIDSGTNRLAGDVPVGTRPLAVASGAGGIWVCRDGGTVAQIDPASRKVVGRPVDVGTDCNDVAVGFGSVWVAGGDDDRVVRIDPGSTPEVEDVIQGDGVAGSAEPVLWVATGAGSVWATQGRRLLRISPKTGRRLQTIPIPPAAGLAAGPALAWVVTATDRNQLLAFGAAGRRQFEKTLDANAVSPVASGAAVWLVVYVGLGEVQRRSVSAPTQINGHFGLGRYPLAVALGDGAAWVVNTEGTVWRLDEALTSVDKRIDTAATARSSLAVGYGNVWVAIQQPS